MKNHNIDLYLRSAFRELNRFSIPDIGTFRKVYRSASLSGDMETVHPPMFAIEFEAYYHDSLSLSTYLQTKLGFPEGESKQIVLSIRNTMLEAFEKKQRFEIPDIGVLRQEEDGKLVYMPVEQEKNLFSTDFFGMKAVSLPGTPANAVAMEHQDNLGPMTKTENAKKKTLAGSIGWKPILVVLLFVGLGALLITNGPFITRNSKLASQREAADSGAMSATPVPENRADSATGALPEAMVQADPVQPEKGTETAPLASPESSANPAAENPPQAGATEEKPLPGLLADALPATEERDATGLTRGLAAAAPTDISVLDTIKRNARITRSEPQPAVQPQAPQPSAERKAPESVAETEAYHLIVGSFSSSQAAVELVQKIEAEGMRATILFPPAGSAQSYRVSVFSSRDKDQVAAYNQMLRSLGKQTGWVYAKPK